ncbi:zinc ribbon-containing protein [Microbulbifer elongatus]|uniref:zinc ribbon-containing protein n=1 Tax=Microbulbifer elongatus TaxID=86173 RepID=UPI001E482FCA|nr:zinc ribbon-containing protein [Microbulbifer elongatus]
MSKKPKEAGKVTNPDLPEEDGKLSTEAKRELEKLVGEELDVEQFTARKAAFLNAWIKDDVHRAEDYLQDLGGELLTQEERVGEWLLDAADPTRTVWPAVMACIKRGDPWALAGETVGEGEELQCLACGYRALPDTGVEVTPCHRCGYGCFRQIVASSGDQQP